MNNIFFFSLDYASFYRPYTSIEKFRERNLKEFQGKTVVATEKVHGTNFRLIGFRDDSGAISVYGGKRTAILEHAEDFFGFQKIIDRYSSNVIDIMSAHPEAKQIDIICELFGGNFHGDKLHDSITIQKGKYANYSKDNDIRVFDIHLDEIWLSWDQIIEFGTKWSLPLVPEVFRGLWEDVKDFNVETFQSLLATEINGVNLQDNPAEGVVLRLETPSTQDHRGMRIKWKCQEMLEGATYKPKDISRKIDNIDRYISMMDQVRFDNFKTKKIFEFNDANIGKI